MNPLMWQWIPDNFLKDEEKIIEFSGEQNYERKPGEFITHTTNTRGEERNIE